MQAGQLVDKRTGRSVRCRLRTRSRGRLTHFSMNWCLQRFGVGCILRSQHCQSRHSTPVFGGKKGWETVAITTSTATAPHELFAIMNPWKSMGSPFNPQESVPSEHSPPHSHPVPGFLNLPLLSELMLAGNNLEED